MQYCTKCLLCIAELHSTETKMKKALQPWRVLSFSTTFYNPTPKLRVTSLPLLVFWVTCMRQHACKLNVHLCSYGGTMTYMYWWRVCCISHVTSCHGSNTWRVRACSIALKSNVTSSTARTSSTRWPWLDVIILRYLSFLLKILPIINVMLITCATIIQSWFTSPGKDSHPGWVVWGQ